MERYFKSNTPITFKIRFMQSDGLTEVNLKKTRRASFVLHSDNGEVVLNDFGYDNLGQYEGAMWFRLYNGLPQGAYNLVGYAVTYEWNKVDVGAIEPITLVVGDDQTLVYNDFGQIPCRVTENEEEGHNGPYIQDGYWYVWNEETHAYVNSGVKATPDIPTEYLSAVTVNNVKYEGYNHNVNLGNLAKRVKINGIEHSPVSGVVDLGYIGGGSGGSAKIYPFNRIEELDNLPADAIARYEGRNDTLVFDGRNYGYGTCFSRDDAGTWFAMGYDGLQYTNTRKVGVYTGTEEVWERLARMPYGVGIEMVISEMVNGVETLDTMLIGSYSTPKLFTHNLSDFAIETANYGYNYLVVKQTKQNHPRKQLKWRVNAFMSETHDYFELEWVDGVATGHIYPAVCMQSTVNDVVAIKEQLTGIKFDYIFRDGQDYTNPVSYNLGNTLRTSIRMDIEPNAIMSTSGANISFSGAFDQSAALVVTIDNQQNESKTVTISKLTELTDGTESTVLNGNITVEPQKQTIATFFYNGENWSLDSQTSGDVPKFAGITSDTISNMEYTNGTLTIDGTPFEGGGGSNVTQNRYYNDNEKCWVAATLLGDSLINQTVVSNNEVDIQVGNNVGQNIILFDYDSDHHLDIGSHEIVKRDNDGRFWILGQEIDTGGGGDEKPDYNGVILFDNAPKHVSIELSYRSRVRLECDADFVVLSFEDSSPRIVEESIGNQQLGVGFGSGGILLYAHRDIIVKVIYGDITVRGIYGNETITLNDAYKQVRPINQGETFASMYQIVAGNEIGVSEGGARYQKYSRSGGSLSSINVYMTNPSYNGHPIKHYLTLYTTASVSSFTCMVYGRNSSGNYYQISRTHSYDTTYGSEVTYPLIWDVALQKWVLGDQ